MTGSRHPWWSGSYIMHTSWPSQVKVTGCTNDGPSERGASGEVGPERCNAIDYAD